MRRTKGARAVVVGVASLLAVARPVRADDKTACIAAANDGQDLRLDGKLRAARARLMACAAPQCPDLVRADCTKWIEELDARIPSIVVTGKRKDDTDIVEATVTVDGAKVADRLDAKALSLDPGTHEVTLTVDAAHVSTQTIVLVEGELGRRVSFRFDDLASASSDVEPHAEPRAELATTASPAPSPFAWVAAGTAVVAFSSFAYFALSGRHDLHAIDATGCAPHCDPGPVDDAKRKLLLGDVSLGVGLVSVGIATWLFLDRGAIATKAPTAAFRVDLAPRPGGGVAAVSGAF